MASYNRGDIVLVPFPFVVRERLNQKLRPALIISDAAVKRRYNDLILAAITSQDVDEVLQSEFRLIEDNEGFDSSGLKKRSVVRCDFLMTIPETLVIRKIGSLSQQIMSQINVCLKDSLGINSYCK